jgi:hypothetical protein
MRFVFPANKFKNAIIAVATALDKEPNSRYPALSSVRLEIRNEHTKAIATDGRRLHVVELKEPSDHQADLLIGPDLIKAISNCSSSGEWIILSVDEDGTIRWTVPKGRRGESALTGTQKPIEGRYPNWVQVVPEPKTHTATATIDSIEFKRWVGHAKSPVPLFKIGTDGYTEFDFTVTFGKDRVPRFDKVDGELILSANLDYLDDATPFKGEIIIEEYPNRVYRVINGPMIAVVMGYRD